MTVRGPPEQAQRIYIRVGGVGGVEGVGREMMNAPREAVAQMYQWFIPTLSFESDS